MEQMLNAGVTWEQETGEQVIQTTRTLGKSEGIWRSGVEWEGLSGLVEMQFCEQGGVLLNAAATQANR